MTEIQKVLFKSIKEKPNDDAPRLAYADWLEANVGVRPCTVCDAMAKSKHNYKRFTCDFCGGTGETSNNNAALSSFIKAQCDKDETSTMDRLPYFKNPLYFWAIMNYGLTSPHPVRILSVLRDYHNAKHMLKENALLPGSATFPICFVRRGFVEHVSCRLDEWLLNGPDLVKWHPVQYVSIVDRQPAQSDDSYNWASINYVGATPQIVHIVPASLVQRDDDIYRFSCDADARLWLSDACIAWAEKQLGTLDV